MNVSVEPFYMINTEAKITCTVLGNPLPIIQWAFRHCNFQPLEDCEVRDSDELSVSFLFNTSTNSDTSYHEQKWICFAGR